MTPRTRWQGWTIVEKDGSLALDAVFHEPFVWKWKTHATETVDENEGQRVVRCELSIKPAARKKERK